MAFKKGNKLGPGRPRGLRNKKTQEAKARVEKVLSMIDQTIEEDIAELSASERVKTYVALLEYQLPKLQRVALANDDESKEQSFKIQIINNSTEINDSSK
ncbi:MAG: hypothetical protein MK212_07490 [Saprospiraceae bacterium]|uniref:hypothetical protein n=1 Tax=Kordia sp. TaxID=1965332 RepID=UPI0025C5F6CF|nr:hypothetical protein [Kordia sp.]MCH2043973.1 hypothetical protein [Saprospiraceae bacterium]MCH2196821.1 hypothetical protein [Kordia sp.]